MKKTFIKTIIAAMTFASTLSFGGLNIMKANALTADQLYTNAYKATSTAISNKDQTSINNARVAIEALRNTGASWAIGEFSKQVDQVQQPILVIICNAINVIQAEDKSGNYKEIDIATAYKSIPTNLPDVWRSSYSSAVDIVQQHYQQKALDAWGVFMHTGVRADHDAAFALLGDIAANAVDREAYRVWMNNVIDGK